MSELSRALEYSLQEIRESLDDLTITNLNQVATGIRDLKEKMASAALKSQPAQQAESEKSSHTEADGCPTELAVLQRFWREHQPAQPSDTELSAQDKFVVIQTLIPALKKAGVTVTGSVKEGWKVKVSPTQPNDSRTEFSDTEMLDWLLSDGDTICEMTDGSFEYYCYVHGRHSGRTPREALIEAIKADRET